MTPHSVERYGCIASNRQNSKSFAQIRGARIRRWRAEVRRKSALMISNGCDRKPALTVLFDTIGRGPPTPEEAGERQVGTEAYQAGASAAGESREGRINNKDKSKQNADHARDREFVDLDSTLDPPTPPPETP